MPSIVLRAPKTFEAGFARIRAELDVPTRFRDAVMVEAEAATMGTSQADRIDARHIGFIAIDPPGATDLDQTYAAERHDGGYRVLYAIADVGDFINPGGELDAEARRRGSTLYSPDTRTPLHPPVLSEDRASLLAGGDKPALLWTIDLDAAANPSAWRLERAMVRTRQAISYAEAQARIDGGGLDPNHSLTLLAEIGTLRREREAERGGVSINLPAQEVVERDGNYALEFDRSLPVERWNAQISLLTGIVAGQTMVDAGVGVLRTLPPPYEQAIGRLRRTAMALTLDWPRQLPYASFVRDLVANDPASNAFLLQATRTLRGAGYVGFDGTVPKHPEHGAIASVYSHVTAPLRRLVDRFGNEILLALFADTDPPTWAIEALDELPSLMGRARQRESALERSMIDFAEALVLEHSVGQVFEGYVVDIDQKRDRAQVQIADPAIVASVDGKGRSLAEKLDLGLEAVDLDARTVTFTPR